MKRLVALLAALVLVAGVGVPALAADPGDLEHSGRVLIALGGDVTVPAGEQADAVIIAQGTATIEGTVNAVVALDADVVTSGALIEELVIIRGTAELGAGTEVVNDVRTLDAEVQQATGVLIGGNVSGLEADLVGLAWFLGAAAIVLWIGFGIATLLAALLLAGLAARQVRSAGALISREPGKTFLAGLLALILPPLVAVLLIITLVGIPAGIGLLIVIWPMVAFVGYLVAAIWVGEQILNRSRTEGAEVSRPYGAAIVGVIVVTVAGIIPLVTFVVSLFGMGAVLLAAWRTLRGRGVTIPVLTPPRPAPVAG